MSFLLDALGKADEDRRRAEVPELRSYRRRESSAWGRLLRVLLLIALLLGAFAAGLFARPWLDKARAPAEQLDPTVDSSARNQPAAGVTSPPAPVPVPETAPVTKLVLEVISWSERSEARFAMINGAVVYEGDTLDSGEQLLRIEEEAVVLQHAGQTIRLTM